jgi:signal transduction protein with GAF and PtsI domain
VGPESKALQVHRSRVIERVLSSGGVIIASGEDGQQAFIAAPIVVRNEVVGVLGVEPESTRQWTQDDLILLQGIAERTGLAVENARLYIQAQRAADREHMINTIASKLQRAPSLALLLESATRELSEALGTDNVYAEISMDKPLARKRREVTDASLEAVEGSAKPDAIAAGTDTPEEAKAEL